MPKTFNSEKWFAHVKTLADAVYGVSDQANVFYAEQVIDEIKGLYPRRLPAGAVQAAEVKKVKNTIDLPYEIRYNIRWMA